MTAPLAKVAHGLMAYDRMSVVGDRLGSVRSTDANGFLHISATPISKAQVSPYPGKEVPDWEQLGLDPDKIYHILRPAEELAKAAPSFRNLPVLDVHIPLSKFNIESPEIKAHQIGATGSNVDFDAPYLMSDMVIFTATAIANIDDGTQKEISCAYGYDIDFTSGEFEGTHYDGRMTEIIGNHVGVVPEGRAGPDVCVADSAPRRLSVADKIRLAFAPTTADKIRSALASLEP